MSELNFEYSSDINAQLKTKKKFKVELQSIGLKIPGNQK